MTLEKCGAENKKIRFGCCSENPDLAYLLPDFLLHVIHHRVFRFDMGVEKAGM